ncbi:16S rRNA (guanine(966)-N(2))-methyltransferase RsmD [Calidifontibacillus oryziterrae]|uniref:16S rRNA (guanine(966)-N(2))-methyltransferase RsmD n=1 Tax=Calidifontibacillus oryziterrae TaxID=1191699 RepID=UPI0003173088|nr:16S rRNA (guanine(966)-N(2))-methyltransferase RsmD [Calidifontibacillus oryziterrae]
MRVIAGTCKGRPLRAVPGSNTRPTTDKIKESMFNIIGPYFDGGQGLDLFGGSGGLGIEALSRGLEKVIFVDRDKKAIEIIKHNISLCKFEEKSEIFCNDAIRALKALAKRNLTFSFIFLDPPYNLKNLEMLITFIDDKNLLTADGLIVAEHGAEFLLPKRIGSLQLKRREVYGSTTAVSIFVQHENTEN